MTDSSCRSSLPRTVLENVTLTTIKFHIYPRTKVDPMFYCVYINTLLKSYPYKVVRLVLDLWWVAEKTRLNTCANNKGADQPEHLRRLISAFVVRCSSFLFEEEASRKLKWIDTWNLLVSHRICHFRAIQPFDFFFLGITEPILVSLKIEFCLSQC